jgi:hypothetical protein
MSVCLELNWLDWNLLDTYLTREIWGLEFVGLGAHYFNII